MVALPLLIPRAIYTTYFPAISSFHGAGDMDRLRNTTERVMAFTMIIMAFIPLAMMAIAPWIIGLLYGEEFLPAVAPFMVLSVWGLVRPVGLLAMAIPQSMNRPSVGAGAMGLTAVLNVVLNAIMIPIYGMMGAALATTVSYIIGFTYLTEISLRMAGSRFPWAPVSKAVASAAMAAVVMHGAFLMLEPSFDSAGTSWSLILPVMVVGFAGLGLYVLLLGLTRAVTVEDARFVRSLGIFGTGRLADVMERIAKIRG
jgi:O-antigen/teichoic acid export membrane protein